jgi:hypothetical protein
MTLQAVAFPAGAATQHNLQVSRQDLLAPDTEAGIPIPAIPAERLLKVVGLGLVAD